MLYSVLRSTFRTFAIFSLCLSLHATDGMNLEGWGSISTGMGGAAMAYDNGLAAMMNNPATLFYMPTGESQLDIGLNSLGPDVSSTLNTPNGSYQASSSSNAFYMPSFGWAMKKERFVLGLGMYAQGGMGCEYLSDSWLGSPCANGDCDLSQGLVNRSEVSMGRVIVPFAYQVNNRFVIGGSVDFVWAGLDLQMSMNEGQFVDMANPQSQFYGQVNGSMVQGLGGMYEPMGGMGISQIHYAYFNFSDDSDYTGETKGNGWAGKLGFLWQARHNLSVGGTYHFETALNDLDSNTASISMGIRADAGMMMQGQPSGEYMDMVLPVQGSIAVKNFQWPASYALGMAWRPTEKWLLALDIKQYAWSEVMDEFTMTFTADQIPENGNMGGSVMNASLYQKWEDQTVYAMGGSYETRFGLTVRLGANLTNNPIPTNYVNPLFPATIENHATMGLGYEVGPGQVNLSMVKAFQKTVTIPAGNATVESRHEQFNWSLQYTHKF